MLDLLALISAIFLIVCCAYAAHYLSPRNHPLETIAVIVMAICIGMAGAPSAGDAGQLLVIVISAIVIIWRKEAQNFVRCRYGAPDPEHPMRRRADFKPMESQQLRQVNGGKLSPHDSA